MGGALVLIVLLCSVGSILSFLYYTCYNIDFFLVLEVFSIFYGPQIEPLPARFISIPLSHQKIVDSLYNIRIHI